MQAQSPIKIACIQLEPQIGQKEANVTRSLERITEAAGRGARLIVLPELCNSGYVFESRQEAFALAEAVPDGPTCEAWLEAARRHDAVIVAGICERAGDALYNSAAIVGPDGFIGTYRKVHLWGAENLFFEPGDLGVPVWKTRFGRMAVAICYDGWFPETYRLAALQGADILCVPTNWVPMPGQPDNMLVMANVLAMGGAHSNSMYVAAADRVGVERGQPFLGSSLIVSHTGFPLAGPASKTAEEIIYAELNLSDARSRRVLNSFNQPLRDRRTDVYDEMLGSGVKRGWY
ncbi:nitrilase family protein [Bradyrhizobium lablabi]|uniref:nitrilase family protein n=1 Tax=Bradyrhizobium lablabi TaxID=722472 RepID=UPI001BA630EB|nr:nitrilase family protein [Bradyrhizobium lablabi]MBR1126076.1 nitrilase family protein [Bradyrhizobium lablabi]